MYIIGIDPGSKGGFVVFDGKKPRWKGPLSKLIEILRGVLKQPQECHVYVEELGPVRHQGVKSTYGQGRNVGWILGVLEAFKVRYTIIKPKDWQECFMIPGKKKGFKSPTIYAAKALWPDTFDDKSPDGQTDAAFIAYFGVLNHEHNE